MNDIIFMAGGISTLWGRVDDEYIAPRIINDSDDLDNVILDLTNMDLLSNFKKIIQNGNVYFLVPKTHLKSFPAISTAYLSDTISQSTILLTVSNPSIKETETNGEI